MNLAIFDVDGTLTRSTGVDDDCLVEAFRAVYQVDLPHLDWSDFFHSTDDGLSLEVCERWCKRVATPEEQAHVKQLFLAKLRETIQNHPDRCREVPGAAEMLRAMGSRQGWAWGIASGAWQESAAIKLAAAGVDVLGSPGTFSHLLPNGKPAVREQIVGATIQRLTDRYLGGDRSRIGRVVYVGDGIWDARAARKLSIGFVGLRHDRRTDALVAEGARHILHSYEDVGVLLDALDRAEPPLRTESPQS